MSARSAETQQCSAIIRGIEGAEVSCRVRGQGSCLADIYARGRRVSSVISRGECRADIDQEAQAIGRPLAPGEAVAALRAIAVIDAFLGALQRVIEDKRAEKS